MITLSKQLRKLASVSTSKRILGYANKAYALEQRVKELEQQLKASHSAMKSLAPVVKYVMSARNNRYDNEGNHYDGGILQ